MKRTNVDTVPSATIPEKMPPKIYFFFRRWGSSLQIMQTSVALFLFLYGVLVGPLAMHSALPPPTINRLFFAEFFLFFKPANTSWPRSSWCTFWIRRWPSDSENSFSIRRRNSVVIGHWIGDAFIQLAWWSKDQIDINSLLLYWHRVSLSPTSPFPPSPSTPMMRHDFTQTCSDYIMRTHNHCPTAIWEYFQYFACSNIFSSSSELIVSRLSSSASSRSNGI